MFKKIISFYVPYILTMAFLLCFLIYIGQIEKLSVSVVECFVFYCFLFVFKKKTTRSLVWALFMLILGAQMASLYTSGDFIIPLTLSNAGEFNTIGLTLLSKLAVIVFCFVFVSWFFYQKFNTGDDTGHTYYACTLLIFLPLINGPFFIFGTALHSYYEQLTFSPSYNYPEIA